MTSPRPRPTPESLRDLALDVAAEVAAMVEQAIGSARSVDTKSSGSDLVTEVDRRAEALIVDRVLATRPGDGFLGEEGTSVDGTSGVRWIIDPIDGTTNFVFGHPGFGVSIAAEVDGLVVAAAVADPSHRQIFDAAEGLGARCNGEIIHVRSSGDLGRALVATGFSYLAERRRRQADVLTTVLPAIADIRRMGSAAVDLCSVALGRVDAYFELGLNEWDLAGGAIIAAEAGAVVIRRTVTEPGHAEAEPPRSVPLIIAAAPGIATALDELLQSAGLG